MRSPFPGMDPFIEGCGLWEDFHDAMIQEVKNNLAQAVPDRYLVRTGERAYVVLATPEGERAHSFKPDVSVVPAPGAARAAATGTALAEAADVEVPVSMRAFVSEEFRESFVEIREVGSDERLVTCIEVLSPSNKRSGAPGWEIYQRKRQALLMGTANLVEIDLLRGGERMPMIDAWPDSPYTLLVAIPPIAVPLVNPDPDIPLELQPLIDAIYVRSRYSRSIDYGKPLTPPLKAEEAAWLHEQRRVIP